MMMTRLNNPLRRRIVPLLLCMATVTFAGCAHSTSTSDSVSAKEAAAMTTPEPTSTSDNPKPTAEEIGKRFLKLIEGLESRQNLSLEHVQEVTGLTLEPSENASFFGYSQGLDEGWFYSFTYIPEAPSVKKGIGLDFEHRGDSFSDMTPVCELDFDYYHKALKAMGYRDVPIYGEIGELRSWRYYKNDITLSIVPQNVVAREAGRSCVKSIGTLNGR